MAESQPRQRSVVSVTVQPWSDGWAWRVQRVEPRPVALLGEGTAPDHESAWADAASVVNNEGEGA